MLQIILATAYAFLLYWALEFVHHLSAEVHNSLVPLYYPDIKIEPQGVDPLVIEAAKIDAWFFETFV
jgi:hypothetical protein